MSPEWRGQKRAERFARLGDAALGNELKVDSNGLNVHESISLLIPSDRLNFLLLHMAKDRKSTETVFLLNLTSM